MTFNYTRRAREAAKQALSFAETAKKEYDLAIDLGESRHEELRADAAMWRARADIWERAVKNSASYAFSLARMALADRERKARKTA